MSGTGYRTEKKEHGDLWTLFKMFARGLLILAILAGIVFVVVPFVENISATNTNNPSGIGTSSDGSAGSSSAGNTGGEITHVDSDEWSADECDVDYHYSNERFSKNNIPETIRIYDDGSNGYCNMYITNLKVSDDGIISFCIENHNYKTSGIRNVGTIVVYTEAWGNTPLDWFKDVVVMPGKKKCFETRNINCGNLKMKFSEQIKIKIS